LACFDTLMTLSSSGGFITGRRERASINGRGVHLARIGSAQTLVCWYQ
jgi:hypothetical protein